MFHFSTCPQLLSSVWTDEENARGGQKFASDTEVQSVVRQWLGQQPVSFVASGIQKLVDRWDRCLNELGRYVEQDAMLSQGEPRDAAISFDTTALCVRLLWHSLGFLYRPTSATVQMLKMHHTVR